MSKLKCLLQLYSVQIGLLLVKILNQYHSVQEQLITVYGNDSNSNINFSDGRPLTPIPVHFNTATKQISETMRLRRRGRRRGLIGRRLLQR